MEFDLEILENIGPNVHLSLRVLFQFTLNWLKKQLNAQLTDSINFLLYFNYD